MSYTEGFQHTIHRFIELYGDRTEGIGDEVYAGLAWIAETKCVLIAGGEAAILQPPSWRRASRLLNLAEQFRRPVLLWDVSFQAGPTGSASTLLNRRTTQNSQLQLLNLPVPIIRVFDRLVETALEPDLAVADATVLLKQKDTDLQPLSIPSGGENLPTLVKVTDSPCRIGSDILALLGHLTTIPVETLVHQRLDGLRWIVEHGH